MGLIGHQLVRAATSWFGDPQSIQRGMPAPLGPEEKRPAAAMQHLGPMGVPWYSPRLPDYNNRAASRYAFQTGQLLYDPVGEGWIVTKRSDLPMRKTGAYLLGGIFWNTTPQNMGLQPGLAPLYTPSQLAQLFTYRTATAITAVPNYLAPGGTEGAQLPGGVGGFGS